MVTATNALISPSFCQQNYSFQILFLLQTGRQRPAQVTSNITFLSFYFASNTDIQIFSDYYDSLVRLSQWRNCKGLQILSCVTSEVNDAKKGKVFCQFSHLQLQKKGKCSLNLSHLQFCNYNRGSVIIVNLLRKHCSFRQGHEDPQTWGEVTQMSPVWQIIL